MGILVHPHFTNSTFGHAAYAGTLGKVYNKAFIFGLYFNHLLTSFFVFMYRLKNYNDFLTYFYIFI